MFVVPRVAVARHILKKLTGCEVAREDLPEGVRQKIAELLGLGTDQPAQHHVAMINSVIDENIRLTLGNFYG